MLSLHFVRKSSFVVITLAINDYVTAVLVSVFAWGEAAGRGGFGTWARRLTIDTFSAPLV